LTFCVNVPSVELEAGQLTATVPVECSPNDPQAELNQVLAALAVGTFTPGAEILRPSASRETRFAKAYPLGTLNTK